MTFSASKLSSRQGTEPAGDGAKEMPLDTWETNSAFEIGTLALRPSHHVSAIAHITNRSMTPDAAPSHPLAPKRPMTEGVQSSTSLVVALLGAVLCVVIKLTH